MMTLIKRSTFKHNPRLCEHDDGTSEIKNSSGFTLMELIVVITIIGLLATMAGPGLLTYITRGHLQSSQLMVAQALNTAYTTARTKPQIIHVSGEKNAAIIRVKTCDNRNNNCSSQDIPFKGLTVLKSDTFDFSFRPPFGDIYGLTEPLSIQLEIKNKPLLGSKTIKIWEKSGLIDVLDE